MVLLIDNYDSFTWNLVQRLGELDPSLEPGRGLVVVRNDEVTVEEAAAMDGGRGPSHVIVSPGPCSPREAGVSSAIIERFAGRVPVLGVCLGHQCIGAVNGMTVSRHEPVHGKTSPVWHDGRGVFAGVPSPFDAMRYHSLVVAVESVPAGWEVSAWTEDRGLKVVMGLRRVWAGGDGREGEAMLEGVQFHPESFLTVEGPRILANFLSAGPPRGIAQAAAE